MQIAIINGPNLDMLGERQPAIYGSKTLSQINEDIAKFAAGEGVNVEFFQFNSEGDIIDCIHNVYCDGIIINAGAYSHYSYAIKDAITCRDIPVIEVHLSNIYKRDEFRRKSVLTDVCVGIISGFNSLGYKLALQAFISGDYIKED